MQRASFPHHSAFVIAPLYPSIYYPQTHLNHHHSHPLLPLLPTVTTTTTILHHCIADTQQKGFYGRSLRKLESLLDKGSGSSDSLALEPDLASRLNGEQVQLLHLNRALLYYMSGEGVCVFGGGVWKRREQMAVGKWQHGRGVERGGACCTSCQV